MPRKIPKSLFDADFRWLWRSSRRFIAKPLQVTSTTRKSNHFCGGPPPHKGSKCPKCKKQLTLLWDLDLNDELIPDYVREGFSPATRLPLYICWQCLAASYVVLSETRINCFPFVDSQVDYLQENESPFQDSPEEVERRPISLSRIPSTIEALLSLSDVVGFDEFDKPAQTTLKQFFKTKIRSDGDLPISQFGGSPLVNQGHGNNVCPNLKCPASTLNHPYGEMTAMFLMKELALIHWKDEPALTQHCIQLLYSVCGICFSLQAEYRCS